MIRSAILLSTLGLLAACSGPAPGEGEGEQAPIAAAGENIWCAANGATKLAQDCTLERGEEEGRAAFVIRHGDGKFRRLVASEDGKNLLAADGVEQSQSALKQDRWEVILGDDRYVVPVKADAPKP